MQLLNWSRPHPWTLDWQQVHSRHLPTLSSTAFVHLTSHPHGKLGPRATKCIFLWYFKESNEYTLLSESEEGIQTKLESRNANFYSRNSTLRRDDEIYEILWSPPASISEGMDPPKVRVAHCQMFKCNWKMNSKNFDGINMPEHPHWFHGWGENVHGGGFTT